MAGYRRRYNKRGKRSTGAKKAVRLAKKALNLINAEHKFQDFLIYSNYTIPTTSSIGLLTGLGQGADYNQRNGNSIKAKSMGIDYALQVRPATQDSCIVRVILFMDHESKGLTPLATDLLMSDDVFARYNPSYTGTRFKVLYDKRHVMGFNDTTNYHAAGAQSVFKKIYRKLGQHVRYNGTTGVQANCSTGHLYILVVSDSSAQCGITMNTRFTYLDN